MAAVAEIKTDPAKEREKEIETLLTYNRRITARIVDLILENERMRRQLETLASFGIKIERGTDNEN